MSKSVSNSIDELVNELQARIDLFKSSLVSSNISLNQENLINLEKIVKNYTETSLDNLSILDLYSFSLIDIKKILKIIGRNDDYIEETINLLKNNGNDISVYETILKMITDYVSEFYSMQKKQNEVISNNIHEYQRIIDSLTSNNSGELFDDIDSLMNIMSSVNLPNDTKSNILVYIANQNCNNYCEQMNSDMENMLKEIIDKYNPSESSKIYEILETLDLDETIDIDSIPSIASSILGNTELSINDTQNALIGYLLNKQYKLFKETESINKKLEIKNYIVSLIQQIIDVEKEIISDIESTIEDYKDFYNNMLQEGYDKYQEYENLSLEELKNKYGSLEIAIELKKYIIIHSMMESLSIINAYDLNKTTEEEEMDYYMTLNRMLELKYMIDNMSELESKNKNKVRE